MSQATADPLALTLPEAARRLSVSVSTIRAMIADGRLQSPASSAAKVPAAASSPHLLTSTPWSRTSLRGPPREN